jgi:hypothetical protein
MAFRAMLSQKSGAAIGENGAGLLGAAEVDGIIIGGLAVEIATGGSDVDHSFRPARLFQQHFEFVAGNANQLLSGILQERQMETEGAGACAGWRKLSIKSRNKFRIV